MFVEKKKKIELPVFYKGGQKITAQEAYKESPAEKSEKRMRKYRLSFSTRSSPLRAPAQLTPRFQTRSGSAKASILLSRA